MAKTRKGDSRESGDSALIEAQVLLPLQFNDGKQVPKSELEEILEEVFQRFQGWTVEGTVSGTYRMRSGEKKVEKLLKVSIVLESSRLAELEGMVASWCIALGQEVMLLKVGQFNVKMIPPGSEP